jgi:hypothetical protein
MSTTSNDGKVHTQMPKIGRYENDGSGNGSN